MTRPPLTDFDINVRNTISRNIRKLMGKMTQAELSEKTGIPASTLSGYIARRSTPRADQVQKLADAFNVPKSTIDPRFSSKAVNDLKLTQSINHYIEATIKSMNNMNDEGKEQVADYANLLDTSGKYKNENPKVINIADYIKDRSETYAESYAESYDELISNARATAGHGAFNYEDHEQFHSVKTDLLPEYDYDSIVEVSGSSMEPMIKDGDIVFVKYNQDFIDGKIYVVNIAGETVIKTCYFERDKLTLVSENKDWEDRIIEGADLNQVKIVGRVIGWATPEK